jgi:sec-independent protein translocase protein TatA
MAENGPFASKLEYWLMGSLSIWHWLIVILVIVLLFGRGKISDLMGDVAKGVKSFKKGLADDDAPARPLESKVDDPTKVEPTKVS